PVSTTPPPSNNPAPGQNPAPVNPQPVTPAPAPRGNVTGLEERYRTLYDRGADVAEFFKRRQAEVGQLRQDIRSRWSSMISYLNRAQDAIRAGNAKDGARYLDLAE